MMRHFVFGRKNNLAAAVRSYHIVAASQKVLKVLELVLAWKV